MHRPGHYCVSALLISNSIPDACSEAIHGVKAGVAQLELVATPEIAQLLGVSRQRADVITKQAGFPEPIASLSVGKIWSKSDVERWMSAHRPKAAGKPRKR